MSIASGELHELLVFDKSDRLGKALKIGQVTGNEMADHLGVSRGTISNYINGHTSPSKSQLRDWALKTGVPLEWIETGHVSDNGGGGGDDGIPTPGGIGSGATPRKITFWLPANESNVRHLPNRRRHVRWTPDRQAA